jgi:hypothetical protein
MQAYCTKIYVETPSTLYYRVQCILAYSHNLGGETDHFHPGLAHCAGFFLLLPVWLAISQLPCSYNLSDTKGGNEVEQGLDPFVPAKWSA